jgi:hypothetical protein
MDPHPPRPDDLSALERRLAGWRPAADGLDADAVLFAAGRASVRPGRARFVWPALAGGMALVAAFLGVWLASERAERLALARRLEAATPTASPAPAAGESPSPDAPAPNSYLAISRVLRQGLDAWPARAAEAGPPPSPHSPNPGVLRAWRRGASIDP